jgi:hypothetical protein
VGNQPEDNPAAIFAPRPLGSPSGSQAKGPAGKNVLKKENNEKNITKTR